MVTFSKRGFAFVLKSLSLNGTIIVQSLHIDNLARVK